MDQRTKEAWNLIDQGLLDLMDSNDALGDAELIAKFKRLQHLEKFVKRLAARVSERIRENTKPGPIDELFTQYKTERSQIDLN